MPYFDYDGDINIDVDDFLNACDSNDIEEIIDALVEDGHIRADQRIVDSEMSAPEQSFEEALNKLHGKWNRLTKEEEIILLTIANKF